ncbi:restriction endonuclease subunit S [Streptomyces sp. NPDC008079]|uniref:restriction endonuclease subunit S n=1 Tax=Streptomyces sp. NPDC008079 TaxID=3364806 RepID=UPI0036EDC5BF
MTAVRTRPLKDFAAPDGLVGGPLGSRLGKRDFVPEGVPVIRGQNLAGDGYFASAGLVFVPAAAADGALARHLAVPGDLVLTQRGTLGQVGIVPAEIHERYVLSPAQARIRVDPDRADTRFLYYCFRDPAMVALLHSRAVNTGVPHVTPEVLGGLPVPARPLPEQRAVAEVLGALDDKIAANARTAATCLELADASFAVAPAGPPARLGEVAELHDGPHATPVKTASGPWFLSISSLDAGRLDLTASAHLSEEDFARWTRRVQPRTGDVLFSYETRLGHAALMPPGVRACLGRRMALLRAKTPSAGGALLLHAYLSPAFQDEIGRRTLRGATVDRLPLGDMPDWPLPLPAEGERAGLSARLEALHASAAQAAAENDTLAALRDTLLPGLVSGRVPVGDAARAVGAAG